MVEHVNGSYRRMSLIGDLSCRYDSRRSFYGKAKIYEDDEESGVYYLMSYSTVVAEARHGVVTDFGKYSQTTSRHQKEFRKQFER